METPVCAIKVLPKELWIGAASSAAGINPANAPALQALRAIAPTADIAPEHLALMTSKYWGSGGVRLTVGFLDNPPADLRARLLSHMNSWAQWANVQFVETATDPQVRIARNEVESGALVGERGVMPRVELHRAGKGPDAGEVGKRVPGP